MGQGRRPGNKWSLEISQELVGVGITKTMNYVCGCKTKFLRSVPFSE